MITSKRQIRTERDRFGGYGTESARTAVIDDDVSVPDNNASNGLYTQAAPQQSIVIQDEPAAPQFRAAMPTQEERPIYSTFQSVNAGVQPLPEREVKQRSPLAKEDLMPTLKTQAYANENVEAKEHAQAQPQRSVRRGLDPKTKVLLVVYVAIALVLAIGVIATGVSISSAQAQTVAISQSITQKQATISEQEAMLAELTDESTIKSSALANGMIEANGADYTATRTEKVNVETPEPHTNGFDKFCDALSELLN